MKLNNGRGKKYAPQRQPPPLLHFPPFTLPSIRPYETPRPPPHKRQYKHTRRNTDKAERQLLTLEHLLDSVHRERDVDLDFLDLDEEGADEGTADGGADRGLEKEKKVRVEFDKAVD